MKNMNNKIIYVTFKIHKIDFVSSHFLQSDFLLIMTKSNEKSFKKIFPAINRAIIFRNENLDNLH